MKYYNEFADLYDDISLGLKGEAEFYLKEAKKANGSVLEAACGTGRVLLPILEAGVDIEGFDISSSMLTVLKRKAKKKGLKPKVWKADMRTFRSRKRYDLIIIPYRAFLHVETSDDQIKALKNFRRHLKKGGRLILNFFYPDFDFMSKHNARISERDTLIVKGEKYRRSECVTYHPIEQLGRVDWILEDAKGHKKKIMKIHLCYIYKKEFELLLRLAGFKNWEVYGGFRNEKLKDKKHEMVWIIYR